MSEQILLSEAQNAAFNVEYHSNVELEQKFQTLEKHFNDRAITALDVGGGNGNFSDRFLDRFTASDSLVVDISEFLLSKNIARPNKRILKASILDLKIIEPGKKYDVIFLNWILHHLVGRSYQDSLDNINECIQLSADRLAPGGLICIAENDYSGYFDSAIPSRLIFELTAVTNPLIASIVRKHANTAGTGVCFLSETSWTHQFMKHGLEKAHNTFEGPDLGLKSWKKLGLFINEARKIHFYLKPV